MRAIASADRALMSSPNLEGAQTLIVSARLSASYFAFLLPLVPPGSYFVNYFLIFLMNVVGKGGVYGNESKYFVPIQQVKVLMKDKNWEETRRRCEVWAYKLDSSTCVGKIMSLQGFAEGGGPPRACLRAMYASIREAYVKSLR